MTANSVKTDRYVMQVTVETVAQVQNVLEIMSAVIKRPLYVCLHVLE
jgi:hypothetical protein